MQTAIIIPVYNPSNNFEHFASELIEAMSLLKNRVIFVNDGCNDDWLDAFARLSQKDNVTVLSHDVNLGKGAALKTAMGHVSNNFPECIGVVTADADGQHSVKDIARICEAAHYDQHKDDLILGVREFDEKTPLKSKIGNVITRLIFYVLTAIKISDTQTGLRFIPYKYLEDMLTISSGGYAFEMEMLLWAKQNNISFHTVPIETIYIDDNKGSHFKPFTDSIKIYAVLFKQVISSSITAVVDLIAFALFFHFTSALFWANAFSRTVAFPVYYYMNRDFVFKQKHLGFHPVPKLILAIIVSGLFSYSLQLAFQTYLSWPEVVSKLLVETFVFFVNFVILRDFVYQKKASA